MPVTGQTAAQLELMLETRIREGVYAVGARIPTVRVSAEEWKVDKNTIARAYKALERKGYLKLIRGRGAFVVSREPATGISDGLWAQRLEHLLAEAQRQSISRESVMREITQAVNRIFQPEGRKLAFVECNLPDVQILGRKLSEAVNHPLQGMLLEDFLARPDDTASQYDMIVTTFYHLSEVRQALSALDVSKVVGVHSMPAHTALLKIARLQAMMIGFVYENPRVADEFVHTIRSYHPNATIMPVSIKETARAQSLCAKADALIVTQMCYDRLMEMRPSAPVILVAMTIDQQSLDFLRARVRDLFPAPIVAANANNYS